MAVAGEAPGRAFAATWRNEQGEVVGTTTAKSMCLWPRLPWRIRFHRDGFEGVVPCGECPGCLELQRMRLAERLHQKYSSTERSHRGASSGRALRTAPGLPPSPRPLFVVRIWAPREVPDPLGIVRKPASKKQPTQWADNHSRLAHKLHRRRGLELEPGMWRLGATSFALLSRDKVSPGMVLRSLGLKHRIEPLRLSRGRRAWRVLTAGLTVAREVYGEQINRWYARGLPKVEREKWEVQKLGKYQSYSRTRSPRAWTGSKLVLVPPEVWQLRRADRRSLRGLLTRASDPEGVKRVMQLVAGVLGGGAGTYGGAGIGSREMRALAAQGLDSGRISGVDRIRSNVTTGSSDVRLPVNVSAPPKAVRQRRHSALEYQEVARRIEARTALPDPDQIITPISEMGGYTSSEHSQGQLMPRELARARRKEWDDARKARAIKESMEIIERMRRKTRGGPRE